MQIVIPVAIAVAFLPFLISLAGRGRVLKLLCFACCLGSVSGAVIIVIGAASWFFAWVFAIIALRQRAKTKRIQQLAVAKPVEGVQSQRSGLRALAHRASSKIETRLR